MIGTAITSGATGEASRPASWRTGTSDGRLRGKRRERTIVLLATSLDVLVWKALRRDQGLDPDRTADHLRALVEGVLGSA